MSAQEKMVMAPGGPGGSRRRKKRSACEIVDEEAGFRTRAFSERSAEANRQEARRRYREYLDRKSETREPRILTVRPKGVRRRKRWENQNWEEE